MSLKYAIGIDIGGTHIKWALIDSNADIQSQGFYNTPENSNEMANVLNNIIDNIKAQSRSISGIGIGVPGFFNSLTGQVEGAYNLKGLNNLSFNELLIQKHQEKVIIDNDANNAAKGEYLFGAAKDIKDTIVLTLGTGIGSGIILNGSIFKGLGRAGEIGHMTLIPNGSICTCGNYGCYEAYGSTTALISMAKESLKREWKSSLTKYNLDQIDGKIISEEAEKGDSLSLNLIDQWTYYIGLGLSNIINLLNLPLIVIGGGISSCGDLILNPIKKHCNHYVLPKLRNSFEIVPAQLKNDAGVLGSASAVFMDE